VVACGACGSQQNCRDKSPKGDWKNTGTRESNRCGGLCRSNCMYSDKGLTNHVETWVSNNPSPRAVDQAIPPQNFASYNFQCCLNIVSDVTIEKSGEILQQCSQTIIDNLSSEEKAEEKEEQNTLTSRLISTKKMAELKKHLSIGIIVIIIFLIVILLIMGIIIILG